MIRLPHPVAPQLNQTAGKGRPTVYWVVGRATNVGKTTVATELIRYLAQREPTAGFKPYGGIQLLQSYDFLCEASAVQNQLLFGPDAVALCSASNVTDDTDLEVIAPSYRLSYPNRDNTLLLRRGAAKLKSREFFQCVSDRSIFQRTDIKELKKRTGLPLGTAVDIFVRKSAEEMDALGKAAAAAAFDHLCRRGIASIVCEGSGLLLPAWANDVVCSHLILVGQRTIRYFPDIGLKLDGIDQADSIPSVAAIDGALRRAGDARSSDYLLSAADTRSQVYSKLFSEWRI